MNWLVDKMRQALAWFHAKVLPNPSGQDQLADHTWPTAVQTLILLSIPKVGIWLGLIPLAYSLYKEFVQDEHYKDFFSKSVEGQDGRVDLFFRLLGSGLGYLTRLWS